MRSIYAEVDEQSLQLRRLTLLDASNGRSDFIFSNFRENYLAKDEMFNFDPPPGVRVLK
jgi:outer membrane lipoprotein-sorting protein